MYFILTNFHRDRKLGHCPWTVLLLLGMDAPWTNAPLWCFYRFSSIFIPNLYISSHSFWASGIKVVLLSGCADKLQSFVLEFLVNFWSPKWGLCAFWTEYALLSRLFLEDYSSDRFQVLHSDSAIIDDVLRRSCDWNNWKLSKLFLDKVLMH